MCCHSSETVMEHYHSGPLGGHFAGNMYITLANCWYWEGMSGDVLKYCKNCPQCDCVWIWLSQQTTVTSYTSACLFQIVGVDTMDLPITQLGNKHMVVFQDFFSKWPRYFQYLIRRLLHWCSSQQIICSLECQRL